MFAILIVVNGNNSNAFVCVNGRRLTFETGILASEAAKALNDSSKAVGSSERYRVVKVESDLNTDKEISDWREREKERFANCTYTFAPWYNEPWYQESLYGNLHFCHISTENPGMVAFTESNEKGIEDKQIRVRAGRYLSNYFGGILSGREIRSWANKVSIETGQIEVCIASTPDEIEQVYKDGPNSCMAHSDSQYDSPFHPTRVYGAGDLNVAYVNRKDEEDTFSIVSRVLCWPAKNLFGRVYGDGGEYDDFLLSYLKDRGYKHYCSHGHYSGFEGARLLRIEYDGMFVCPYLDHHSRVTDKGKYLVIDDDGEISAQQTNGLSGPCGETCDQCGDGFHMEDGGAYVESYGNICESCLENRFFYCSSCDEYRHEESSTHVHNNNGRVTDTVCNSCAEDNPSCYDCGNTMESDDCLTQIENTDESICQDCCSLRDCFQCDDCGNDFDDAQRNALGHDTYCDDCAENHCEDTDSENSILPNPRPFTDSERAELEANGQLSLLLQPSIRIIWPASIDYDSQQTLVEPSLEQSAYRRRA
jgi:hypothetical protein